MYNAAAGFDLRPPGETGEKFLKKRNFFYKSTSKYLEAMLTFASYDTHSF